LHRGTARSGRTRSCSAMSNRQWNVHRLQVHDAVCQTPTPKPAQVLRYRTHA
jgi:hypothetical protein